MGVVTGRGGRGYRALLQENVKDALKLFTEDMVEVRGLPRHNVLEHLSQCAPDLVVPYLVSACTCTSAECACT